MSGLVYELKLTHRWKNNAPCVTHRYRTHAWNDDDMREQIAKIAAYQGVLIDVEILGRYED